MKFQIYCILLVILLNHNKLLPMSNITAWFWSNDSQTIDADDYWSCYQRESQRQQLDLQQKEQQQQETEQFWEKVGSKMVSESELYEKRKEIERIEREKEDEIERVKREKQNDFFIMLKKAQDELKVKNEKQKQHDSILSSTQEGDQHNLILSSIKGGQRLL